MQPTIIAPKHAAARVFHDPVTSEDLPIIIMIATATAPAPMKPPRLFRLLRIIERLNLIHCHRRLTGRRTDHLYARSRAITQAYLTAAAASQP